VGRSHQGRSGETAEVALGVLDLDLGIGGRPHRHEQQVIDAGATEAKDRPA
jgi:hypothetical protein